MTEFSAFPGAGGAVDLTISGKNDAHLQPFVAMNIRGGGGGVHERGTATDICYRMTSFSPSTHLSFAQRRGMERVHLPTYRIPYHYREQINSLSAVHASAAPAIRARGRETSAVGLPRSRARSSPDQS